MVKLAGTVLVTGGAGFIGSHIVDKVISLPEVTQVIVLDDFSNGRVENLQHHLRNPKFKLVRGDLRDEELVSRLVRKAKGRSGFSTVSGWGSKVSTPAQRCRLRAASNMSPISA